MDTGAIAMIVYVIPDVNEHITKLFCAATRVFSNIFVSLNNVLISAGVLGKLPFVMLESALFLDNIDKSDFATDNFALRCTPL